ncbi:MAG: hypothetical protein JWQ25_2115 [Daejeonella sp.]|nr:hypothetical protein [Daejeonella sp.]
MPKSFKLLVILVASSLFIPYGYSQQNVKTSEFADVYSYKKFNNHHYLVYKAYDSLRNIFSIGDLGEKQPIISSVFYHIFDYYLSTDSILSLAAYKSVPIVSGKVKDTLILAFYRYDVKQGLLLDSIPLLDLIYKKFDEQGYLQIKKRNGAGFVTSHLKYDGTETDDGDKYLNPHTNQGFILKRNYSDGLFNIQFNNGSSLAAPKVRVQPEQHLIIEDAANNIRYYTNTGIAKTEDFGEALNFPNYNNEITAAVKKDGSWYIINGNPLNQFNIKFPDGYTADTAKHFRGYNDRMFLRVKSNDKVFWSMLVVGSDSIRVGFRLAYPSILPLFLYNGKYYLLVEDKDDNVYIIKYDPDIQKVAVLEGLGKADLNQSEILSQNKTNLQCRIALHQLKSQATELIDIDINGTTEKIGNVVKVDTVSKYYSMGNWLGLKLPKGSWYFREKDAFSTFSKNKILKDALLKERITSLQPFKEIELKSGKK